MPNISEILAEFYVFRARASVSSANLAYIQNSGLEFETKIPISDILTVKNVFTVIEQMGVLKTEHRFEEHTLFEDSDGSQVCTIFLPDFNTLWIKTKTRNQVLTTPILHLPLVTRVGVKYKPTEQGYDKALHRAGQLPILSQFDKDCINVYFTFSSYIFSLSFSLARNASSFKRFEMEFEYEGHSPNVNGPSRQDILLLFERLFLEKFPDLISKLNAETKYESLLLRRSPALLDITVDDT